MLARQAKLFWIAFRRLSFLSQHPLQSESPENLGQAAVYFPLVGFIFGLGLSGIYFTSAKILKDEFTCFLIILLMLFRSRWRFARALMDIVNKLVERSRFLTRFFPESISGLRVWGIAGVVVLLVIKYWSLLHIGAGWVYPILILSPTLSAWSRVYLSHSLGFTPMAQSPTLSDLRHVKMKEFWIATVFTTLVAGWFMELSGLFLLLFVSLFTAVVEKVCLAKRWQHMVSVIGAVMEMNEGLVIFLAIVIRKIFFFAVGEGIWL